ncbi:16S rRNA (guanine(966)-N(2))-methyltransferase RsmD [Verrucomicrobiota bacterium]
MRITGGTLSGRQIRVARTGVRPTQDMVREALFSMLAGRVAGCRFLDLFAGSGAVGLEAWSRGAELVQWVELSKRAVPILRRNIKELCGEKGRVWAGDVARYLKQAGGEAQFDVVFADPPYAEPRSGDGRREWLERLLSALGEGEVLAPDGVFVMEQRADEPLCEHEGWELLRDRRYGEARLRIFSQ